MFRHRFDGIIGTLTLSSALPGAVSVSMITPRPSVDHTLEIANGVTIARVRDNVTSAAGAWRQFSFTYRLSSLAGGNNKRFTITIATGKCTFVNDAAPRNACPAFRTPYGMPLNHAGTISRTYPNAEHASLLVRSGAQAGDNQNNVWMAMVTATDTGGDNFSGFNLTLGQALINAGISPNTRDTRTSATIGGNFGTPLVYASYLGYYNLVTMLLSAGASINATLTQPAYTNQTATISIGYTPLDAANMTIVNQQVYLHTWRRPFMIATMKAQNAKCNLNCNPGDTNLQGVVQQ